MSLFIKFWRRKGDWVILESANPAYEPIRLPIEEVAGAWPIVSRVFAGMITKKLP